MVIASVPYIFISFKSVKLIVLLVLTEKLLSWLFNKANHKAHYVLFVPAGLGVNAKRLSKNS